MAALPNSPTNPAKEICPNCGDSVDQLDDFTGWCSKCTPAKVYNWLEAYLRKNADDLEFYIAQDFTFKQALQKLNSPIHKPRCLSCHRIIKRGRATAVFCRKTERCRKWSRRYVYLYSERRLSKSEALAQVMQELDS